MNKYVEYAQYAQHVKYAEYGEYVQYAEYDQYVEYAKYEIPICISTPPFAHRIPPLNITNMQKNCKSMQNIDSPCFYMQYIYIYI